MANVIYGFTPESFEARYKVADYHYGTEPNAFLVSQASRFTPGTKALLPGDGEGRNGVWLAAQGLDVTTFDPSPFGVEKSSRLAAERGVAIHAHRASVENWEWRENSFDLVALIFLPLPPDLRRLAHAKSLETLRPGGLIVLEMFSPRQIELRKQGAAGGPQEIERLFTCEMLRSDFAGAHFLQLEETEADFSSHAHHGRCGVVRMVAQKAA